MQCSWTTVCTGIQLLLNILAWHICWFSREFFIPFCSDSLWTDGHQQLVCYNGEYSPSLIVVYCCNSYSSFTPSLAACASTHTHTHTHTHIHMQTHTQHTHNTHTQHAHTYTHLYTYMVHTRIAIHTPVHIVRLLLHSVNLIRGMVEG